jgi:hypothetical protein
MEGSAQEWVACAGCERDAGRETGTFTSLRRFGVVSSSELVHMRFLRGDACSEAYSDVARSAVADDNVHIVIQETLGRKAEGSNSSGHARRLTARFARKSGLATRS